MNAGMYGMADGRGMAGRKLIGRVGASTTPQPLTSPATAFSSLVGRNAPAAVTLAANTRTLVLSASGTGALRACALEATGVGTLTLTIEVFIDGVRVINVGLASVDGNANAGISAAGGIYGSVPSLDFLPFTTSCEVYFTSSGTGAHNNIVLVDLYQ